MIGLFFGACLPLHRSKSASVAVVLLTVNLALVKTTEITFDTRPREGQQGQCFRVQSFEGCPLFAPGQRAGDWESQAMEAHVAGGIHPSIPSFSCQLASV